MAYYVPMVVPNATQPQWDRDQCHMEEPEYQGAVGPEEYRELSPASRMTDLPRGDQPSAVRGRPMSPHPSALRGFRGGRTSWSNSYRRTGQEPAIGTNRVRRFARGPSGRSERQTGFPKWSQQGFTDTWRRPKRWPPQQSNEKV
jgi:hypothetical protein